MKVTFKNRLKIIKNYDGMPRIAFDHGIECNLKMFIEKTKPAKIGETISKLDWKITIEGGNETLINQYRKELSLIFTTYIKRRTKKTANQMLFGDLESLAQTRSI